MTKPRVIVCLATCAALLVCAGESHAQPRASDNPAPTGSQHHSGPRPGVPYVNLSIPPVLSDIELDLWNQLLQLSEPQIAECRRRYVLFAEQVQSIRAAEEPSLWTRSQELASLAFQSPEGADEYVQLMHARTQFVDKIVRLEDQLISDLPDILSPQQQEAIPRVRSLRCRLRASAFPCMDPAATIDLEIMLLAALAGNENRASLLHLCDPILADYSEAACTEWREYYNISLRNLVQAVPLRAQATVLNRVAFESRRPTPHPGAVPLFEQAARLDKEIAQAAIRRSEMNSEYLLQVVQRLPESLAVTLVAEYRRIAFPPVYPNPFDVEELLLAVEQVTSDQPEQAIAIQSISTSVLERCSSLNDQMETVYVEYWHRQMLEPAFALQGFPDYQHRLDSLQASRKSAALTAVDSLVALLSPAQLDMVQARIENWKAAAKNHLPRRTGIHYWP